MKTLAAAIATMLITFGTITSCSTKKEEHTQPKRETIYIRPDQVDSVKTLYNISEDDQDQENGGFPIITIMCPCGKTVVVPKKCPPQDC